MSNQTWNNDPEPEGSGDDGQNPGYTPSDSNQGSDAGQAPSISSGSEAPAGGGYNPPSYDSTSNDGSAAGGYNPPSYDSTSNDGSAGGGYSTDAPTTASGSDAPAGGGYNPPSYGAPSSTSGSDAPSYGAPSTPDQSFGQTPSYGAPSQDYGQPQQSYGQDQGQSYGQPSGQDYGQQQSYGGSYDANAGQSQYGAPSGGYDPNAGQQAGYGAPTPYGGGYQPNPYGGGPQLATWGRRAIGGLIDYVAPGIVITVLTNLIFGQGSGVGGFVQFVLTLAFWAYNSGYRVATTGYSFGHQIGKVRVVMEDSGQTPPLNTAILRAVCHMLDSWACLIGWLFPLWDAKKQTFADKIGKTVVLDEQNKPA